MTQRPAQFRGKGRLLLFAFGDFAFNLYWQSIMLFLLFYYTDALELPIGDRGDDLHGRVGMGRDRQFRRRHLSSTARHERSATARS